MAVDFLKRLLPTDRTFILPLFHKTSCQESCLSSLFQRIECVSQYCLKKGVSTTFETARLGLSTTISTGVSAAALGMSLAEMALLTPDAYDNAMQDMAAFYNLDLVTYLSSGGEKMFNDPVNRVLLPISYYTVNLALVCWVASKALLPQLKPLAQSINQAEIRVLEKLTSTFPKKTS